MLYWCPVKSEEVSKEMGLKHCFPWSGAEQLSAPHTESLLGEGSAVLNDAPLKPVSDHALHFNVKDPKCLC